MKITTQILLVLSALALTACSGGGSTSTGGVYLTHAEVAEQFVERLYLDKGFDITLVKTHTEQYDYIVVQDDDFNTYDAYYIGEYNVGENLSDYLFDYADNFFYDLDYIGGNLYQDYTTGYIFEQNKREVNLDADKLQYSRELVAVDRGAKKLMEQFDFLSSESAIQFATVARDLHNIPAGSRDAGTIDALAEGVLGASVTDYMSAIKSHMKGDSGSFNALKEKAAELHTAGDIEAIDEVITSLLVN